MNLNPELQQRHFKLSLFVSSQRLLFNQKAWVALSKRPLGAK
jgi:hypothetical protein